ncbi:hypothetical protein SS50377_20921 [Spironucleus salmonicida]|uniref:Uncharacterized protein n=1 Tax=Spironucleus salmonicida TaxID=348837 RepID=V6LS36_9EUKA|nr:hypothetical protein SS50377_20921 [Spironucleus salmonicida]|eukprot:EST43594.1 hypothetical protein SS50377_16636 [Spironucleus salmonicida]
MFPKFAQERGCRTIVIYPDDLETQVSVAIKYKPQNFASFIAFPHQEATYYAENQNILLKLRHNESNQVDLAKVLAEAVKNKPARLDQMASEDVFSKTRSEVPSLISQTDGYIFADDCYNLAPQANQYIHQIFTAGGHLNYEFNGVPRPTTTQELLFNFLKEVIGRSIQGIEKQEMIEFPSSASQATQQILKSVEQNMQQPEEINYETVNALSNNIYGAGGRTLIPKSNIPLFHKRRKLDPSVFPDNLSSYICMVILPDDIGSTELKIWQEVLFDKLGFAGVELIQQSVAVSAVTGRGGLVFSSSLQKTSLTCVEPFYPVIHGLQAPVHSNILNILSGFQFFMRNSKQLEKSAQMLGFLFDIKNLQDEDYISVMSQIGVPEDVTTYIKGLDKAIQKSSLHFILFQVSKSLISLFQQQAFSLNLNDNNQVNFSINYPVPQNGTFTSFGSNFSLRLGPIGLASASLALKPTAASQKLRSVQYLDLRTTFDPACEQRDVPKTTKVQLERNELGEMIVNGRRMLDFSEDLSADTCVGSIGELTNGLIDFLYKSHLANEVFARQAGRRVEEAKNIETEDQEKAASAKRIQEICANLILMGGIGYVGGIQEEIYKVLKLQYPQIELLRDEWFDSHNGGPWLAGALLCLTDGVIENAVSKEEYVGIGTRVWIEKAPFLYP